MKFLLRVCNYWEISKNFSSVKKIYHWHSLKKLFQHSKGYSSTGHSELLLRSLLHLSDISNPAKPQKLATSWFELLSFYFWKSSVLNESKCTQLEISAAFLKYASRAERVMEEFFLQVAYLSFCFDWIILFFSPKLILLPFFASTFWKLCLISFRAT